MKDAQFNRDDIAITILMEAVAQVGMKAIMESARCNGPQSVAAELAKLSFSIADAMLKERAQ